MPRNVSPRAFGVQSIYQPLETARPREIPCFAGFLTVFLEWENTGVGALHYMLWFSLDLVLYVVDALRTFVGHRQSGNRSTRHGTEVLYRPSKLLNLRAISVSQNWSGSESSCGDGRLASLSSKRAAVPILWF